MELENPIFLNPDEPAFRLIQESRGRCLLLCLTAHCGSHAHQLSNVHRWLGCTFLANVTAQSYRAIRTSLSLLRLCFDARGPS